MKPKEKAKELVDKMYSVDDYDDYNAPAMQYEHARKCALIAVEELIRNSFPGVIKCHWEEVKQEIEKL